MAVRMIKWGAGAIIALAVIIALAIAALDTQAGHRVVTDQLRGYVLASGLNIRAQTIEGSLYSRMILRDVEIRDAKGAFMKSPAVVLDWRPFSYFASSVNLPELSAADATMIRMPSLVYDPNEPLLPDIDVNIGKMAIDRFRIEPAVTGRRHIVRFASSLDLADGRAKLSASARAVIAAGVSGGDTLALVLDAVPTANRLIIDAQIAAPAGGLVDSYARLGKSSRFAVGGRGTWQSWQGSATAAIADVPIVDLALAARAGTFSLSGAVTPGSLITGPAAKLITPALRVSGQTTLVDRRADMRLTLSSDALVATAAGVVDLGRSAFNQLQVAAILLRPSALADNLAGRGVRLAALLDGDFATPAIAYRMSAAQLSFGQTGIEGLQASGTTRSANGAFIVPVSATARRVSGLNTAAGELLTNLSIEGDLAWSAGRVVSDNLKLKSNRIDATAIVIADLTTGRYTGALKGRVNDYEVNGLGRVNLFTDAKLITDPRGGFGITGMVRINTRRIDNAAVAGQLGGQAVITARFGFDADGVVSVQSLRMDAPGLSITSGGGRYLPSGQLMFEARGVSQQYGPVTVTATGTILRPDVRLRAARPFIGIQLADVEARLVGGAAGYAIVARGNSAYGPFFADLVLRSGSGPLRVDINRGRIAGIDVRGTIAQSSAGPFGGTLGFAGSGIRGTARLSAAGRYQRVDADLVANGARIPGDQAITIGNGSARATLILYPSAPSVSADFKVTNASQGTLTVASAQGRVRYQKGTGSAAIVASGRQGTPFSLAAQAALSPGRVVANARGVVSNIAMRLAAPAVATKVNGDWVLAPATVLLPQGKVVIDGRYGAAVKVRAALENVDLSLMQAVSPGMGLGGKASGTIDYANGRGGPVGAAKLVVSRFTRTAAYSVSAPVDIVARASLAGNSGDIRALIKRGAAPIGQVRVLLGPLGGGATLAQRLGSAALLGGIRFNGPAEILWALTGSADQLVSGPVIVAADFGGRVNQPTLRGIVRATALRYENQTYGTLITNLAVAGTFNRSQLQLASLNGKAGRGTISGRGTIGLDAAEKFPLDLTLDFANAQLASSDALGATATGTIKIVNGPGGGSITGDLVIPEARYEIVRQGAADVAELSGVRRKTGTAAQQTAGQTAVATSPPSPFTLNLRVRAAAQIFVSGMGLEAEWSTDTRVTGNASAPVVSGRLDLVRGTYSFAGKRFDLDNDGRILFNGKSFTNPEIDLTARTTVEGLSARIEISGRAQNPQIAFSSTPALPQDEVLSRLLFGGSVTSLSPTQAVQLAAALGSLGSSGGGLNPLGKLRGLTGLSRLRILGADKAAGRGTAIAAGRYLAKNIYVEVITDARGFTATQLEISLSRVLSILSQTSSFGGSNAAIRYSRDY